MVYDSHTNQGVSMNRSIKFVILLVFIMLPSTTYALKLTIYDDGKSCPSNCDAHVVFDKNMNGTVYAHKPNSSSDNYNKCKINENCEICFDKNNKNQCITVMYRGNGPHKNTFDFTPAFYAKWCGKSNKPELLQEQCDLLKKQESKLNGRVNCIENKDHRLCKKLMKKARDEKKQDLTKYAHCKKHGEKKYNKGKKNRQMRIHDCAYEYESNGKSSKSGKTWHKLLPAACRDNTFVGRDGLDCCSGIKFVDAALGVECIDFYPEEVTSRQ